jgi:hypothetical protein
MSQNECMKPEDFKRFAKKGHNACNGGTGVVGQDTKTGAWIPCDCVMKNLRRQFKANVVMANKDVIIPKVEIIELFKRYHDRFAFWRGIFHFLRIKPLASHFAFRSMVFKTSIGLIHSGMVQPK